MYLQRSVLSKWCIYKEMYLINDVFTKKRIQEMMHLQRNVSGKWCFYTETYLVNDVYTKKRIW